MRTPARHVEDVEKLTKEIARQEHQKWWYSISTLEREAWYNAHCPCDHKYVYDGPDDDGLREARSYDPYFYTRHTPEHSIELFFKGECKCNGCIAGVGIERTKRSAFKLTVQLIFVFMAVKVGG